MSTYRRIQINQVATLNKMLDGRAYGARELGVPAVEMTKLCALGKVECLNRGSIKGPFDSDGVLRYRLACVKQFTIDFAVAC